MIYCIGNSHAHFFTSVSVSMRNGWNGDFADGEFLSLSMGPILAHGFTTNHLHSAIEALQTCPRKFIPDADFVLLAVGEIDCRHHILKQVEEQSRPVEELTIECVDGLFESALAIRDEGYNILGWGGHASTRSDPSARGLPITGTCLERNAIARRWSDRMEQRCAENDMPFLSIVDDMIDPDGMTTEGILYDDAHMHPPAMLPYVIEKLKEKKIL